MSDPIKRDVHQRLHMFLQGIGEGSQKKATPYFSSLDSQMKWESLSAEALNMGSSDRQTLDRPEFRMHDRTYDTRPMRVRKTDLFLPSLDPEWLNCVKETLKTCQFSDPDPSHQLKEMWTTTPKAKKVSARRKKP